MKIQVNVTEKDIQKAIEQRGNTLLSKCCPIWQALHRMYPDKDIEVGLHTVFFLSKNAMYLPLVAEALIHDFDSHRIVKPISFTLTLVD